MTFFSQVNLERFLKYVLLPVIIIDALAVLGESLWFLLR